MHVSEEEQELEWLKEQLVEIAREIENMIEAEEKKLADVERPSKKALSLGKRRALKDVLKLLDEKLW